MSQSGDQPQEEGRLKIPGQPGEDHGDPHQGQGEADHPPGPQSGGQYPANQGHGQIPDQVARADQTELGIIQMQAVLHGRQDDGVGHAPEPMGPDGHQQTGEDHDPAVMDFGFRT